MQSFYLREINCSLNHKDKINCNYALQVYINMGTLNEWAIATSNSKGNIIANIVLSICREK